MKTRAGAVAPAGRRPGSLLLKKEIGPRHTPGTAPPVLNDPDSAPPAALPGSPEPLWNHVPGGTLPSAPAMPSWRQEGGINGGENRSPLPDARRFAALSTLPEGRRLPTRRDVPLAKHLRQEPNPAEAPPPAAPESLAMQLPPAASRQLGFNCPSCFAVLIIKDPVTYDGRPAPCPTCGIRIQPPQCVPESPFSIVHRAAPANLPG